MRRVQRNERGSALLIALAFLGVFSLFLVATLTSAESGLHVSDSLKVQPKNMYGADGAVEQAIQKVRYAVTEGVEDDTSCFNDPTVQVNGTWHYIECEPQTGSGKSPYDSSSPTLGIQAFSNGAAGEKGYVQRKNGTIRVDGGLYSAAGVDFQNGSDCPGTNCQQLNLCANNAKTVRDAIFVGTSGNAPTNSVTSVSAGFKNDANETDVGAPIVGLDIPGNTKINSVLNAASIGISNNTRVVGINREITFRENYPALNTHCHPDPGKSHGDIRVVGMDCPLNRVTAATFSCNKSPLDPLNPTDPLYPPDQTTDFATPTLPTCAGTNKVVAFSPGKYTDVAGLNALVASSSCNGKILYFNPGTYYFDFTGAANPVWSLNNGNVSIVAGDKTWDNRGVMLGSMNKGSTSLSVTLPSGASSLSNTPMPSGDVGKFVIGPADLPAGTTIKKVDSSTTATLSQPAAAKFSSIPLTLGTQDSLCDKRTSPSHPGTEFIFGGPSQLNVGSSRFEICAPVGAASRQQIAIYGAALPLGSLVPQNGCVTAQPYPGVGCAFVTATGVMIVHGTVYAPTAAFDMTNKQVNYQVISRGILARTIHLELFPNAAFTEPVIYSPDYGTVIGADRQMLLTAYRCPNPTTKCMSGGTPKLRAMIRIQDHEDPPNQANVSPGYKVTNESWTLLR